jgi:hypothetical protein
MRSLKAVLVSVGLVSSAIVIAPQANAATLSGFAFGTAVDNTTNPTQDVNLQSVTIGSLNINSFETVRTANIRQQLITKPTSEQGPASSDRGDAVSNATCPAVDAGMTNANVVASLGNLNLNCIIDTENGIGISEIDVFFNPSKLVNTFFFWERGQESDLQVEGLDINGNVVTPKFKINRTAWTPAGFGINTTETTQAQMLGSYGLRSDTRLHGLRLFSRENFNGPDFKVVATQVPEPATMLGLGAVSGAALLLRRRKQQVQG